jgi:hypothetical protein
MITVFTLSDWVDIIIFVGMLVGFVFIVIVLAIDRWVTETPEQKRECAVRALHESWAAYRRWQDDGDPQTFASWVDDELKDLPP